MTRICSIEGCDTEPKKRGFCMRHYRLWRREQMIAKGLLCSVEGCGKPVHSHGYCSSHSSRWKAHGHPLLGRPSYEAVAAEFNRIAQLRGVKECVVWPFSRSPRGYGVYNPNGRRSQHVHREICRVAHGDPANEKLHAAHSCGNGHLGCVNPDHLRWATAKENAADATLHGVRRSGTGVHTAKLTPSDVRDIRALSKEGAVTYHLSLQYGVTWHTIKAVIDGKSWATVR